MRRRIRWTRAGKWAGLAACAALLVVWIASGCVFVAWQGRGLGYAGLHAGVLFAGDDAAGPGGASGGTGWYLSRDWMGFLWSPKWGCWGGYWSCVVPLWLLGVPVLVVTLAAFQLDARARRLELPGLCASCGYDLTDNTSSICPECGAPDPRRSLPPF